MDHDAPEREILNLMETTMKHDRRSPELKATHELARLALHRRMWARIAFSVYSCGLSADHFSVMTRKTSAQMRSFGEACKRAFPVDDDVIAEIAGR